MSMNASHFDRRGFLAATAASVTALVLPASAFAAQSSEIQALWAQAETLKSRMAPFAVEINAAFAAGGVPGWMRLKGAANALGEARYQALTAILRATPRSSRDVDLMIAASEDHDMVQGPRVWARKQIVRGAGELAAA